MAIKSFQGKRAEPEKPVEEPILVEDYMSTSLITFRKDEKIADVIAKLVANRISGGPVVNGQNELLGIISEGDCLKQISDSRYYNMPMEDLTVEKHMTCNVETIDGKMNVLDAAKKFVELKHRRFPILEDGKLVGQISQSDVLKAAMELKGDTWRT
ncbi:CBS domain-containing protein [Zunongwangia sp. F260]|uniref:CBS domain-containing protein n=2 Tax=Autumnicola TaxID=3160927 RepID=A0ABU3CHE4_9FLAO|nr:MULTISPECIES: CBS domain-containing protein [unclassified Zunongwangia]MDT0645657.1 CBS domain-containing protein [Zunongwangia sp. F260]MDT0685338.1 CBS domain-containing protein [Zunongwangia sp. F225]